MKTVQELVDFFFHNPERAALTDLPGHCKWCGNMAIDDEHLMHDPSGARPPHRFCSADCLAAAESILDGLTEAQVQELGQAIDMAQPKDS